MATMQQDFKEDLETMHRMFQEGTPFAFVRFGDGERALAEGRPLHVNKPYEEWKSSNQPSPFSHRMVAALTEDLPGYYVGISCPCCDADSHTWYRGQVGVPSERLTYANLFVNANYRRFLELGWRGKACLVASRGGEYAVARNAVNGPQQLDELDRVVDQLLQERRPILVAAGPASEVIIHRYWKFGHRLYPIVDIGSALDVQLHGEATRAYHDPHSCYAKRVCHWS